MDDDQAYRALDLLVEADAEAKVQEAVFFACADLLNLEVDLLFFDTTSTYFEAEPDGVDDDDRSGRRSGRCGHSKDHRPDLPQVVIGLAVTREGIPVRVWVWPGNTNDQTVISEVKDDLRGWRLGRCVWVVDRGFSSDENLRYLTRGGGHWIAGERMRDGSPDAQAALARPGRYQTVRDNLRVKDVRVGDGDASQALRRLPQPGRGRPRQGRARRSRSPGSRPSSTGSKRRGARRRPTRQRQAHTRAECALRDHPTLSRYLRQTTTGRLLIDRGKIAAEERLDGKYLLSTSDPDLTAEEIALGYKNLREAERSFRDLKTTLELRPVFHRLEHRIRAHVLVCWLALLLIRIAERADRPELAADRAPSCNACTSSPSQGPAGTVQQTTAADRRPARDPRRARDRAATPDHRARTRLNRRRTPRPAVGTRLPSRQTAKTPAQHATSTPIRVPINCGTRAGWFAGSTWLLAPRGDQRMLSGGERAGELLARVEQVLRVEEALDLRVQRRAPAG